jgi:hypothetical protein
MFSSFVRNEVMMQAMMQEQQHETLMQHHKEALSDEMAVLHETIMAGVRQEKDCM